MLRYHVYTFYKCKIPLPMKLKNYVYLFFSSDFLLVQHSQMLEEEDDCQSVVVLLLPIQFTWRILHIKPNYESICRGTFCFQRHLGKTLSR